MHKTFNVFFLTGLIVKAHSFIEHTDTFPHRERREGEASREREKRDITHTPFDLGQHNQRKTGGGLHVYNVSPATGVAALSLSLGGRNQKGRSKTALSRNQSAHPPPGDTSGAPRNHPSFGGFPGTRGPLLFFCFLGGNDVYIGGIDQRTNEEWGKRGSAVGEHKGKTAAALTGRARPHTPFSSPLPTLPTV